MERKNPPVAGFFEGAGNEPDTRQVGDPKHDSSERSELHSPEKADIDLPYYSLSRFNTLPHFLVYTCARTPTQGENFLLKNTVQVYVVEDLLGNEAVVHQLVFIEPQANFSLCIVEII